MRTKFIEWFLRVSISIGFLSACADRLGLWPPKISAWGNWSVFVSYTKTLLPFLSGSIVNFSAVAATTLEIGFGILLLTKYKTSFIAICSGVLLLLFGLAMCVSVHVKAALDYSVFTASAAAFSLSFITKKPASTQPE